MNISDTRKRIAFFICVGILLLSIASVSATVTVYMQGGTVFEVSDEEDTLLADYFILNDEAQRITLFSDLYCSSCRELAPWFEVFMQAYPDIIQEYDLNEEENRELLEDYKIAFSHDRVLTPSIFVEGVDGSGFVLEGVESIKLYLEPLVLRMYHIEDIFDEDKLIVVEN
jgi:thiol-disulfide isomerase/thioredoxin